MRVNKRAVLFVRLVHDRRKHEEQLAHSEPVVARCRRVERHVHTGLLHRVVLRLVLKGVVHLEGRATPQVARKLAFRPLRMVRVLHVHEGKGRLARRVVDVHLVNRPLCLEVQPQRLRLRPHRKPAHQKNPCHRLLVLDPRPLRTPCVARRGRSLDGRLTHVSNSFPDVNHWVA